MRELLAAKADPHSLSPDGLSAVMLAASQGHTHTVSLLLEDAKLDPNLKHGPPVALLSMQRLLGITRSRSRSCCEAVQR